MKIGFIGLGQMGRGMVARLLDAGHEVRAWNRTQSAGTALAERGLILAKVPDDTLAGDVVISMLADDVAVESVWINSGLLQKMRPGSLHLNMASISWRMGVRLNGLHRATSVRYVSAPVFGRPEFAARGELDIIAAGEPSAIARCVPVFEQLGRRWFNVAAEAPKANALKVARNFLLATIIESMGEAMALVEKAGLAACRT